MRYTGGEPARYLRLRMTHDSTDTTGDPGAGDGDSPSDSASDTTPPPSGFTNAPEGSVGSVMRHAEVDGAGASPGSGATGPGGTVMRDGVVSDGEAREREPGEEG